jgi:hypothetical protein
MVPGYISSRKHTHFGFAYAFTLLGIQKPYANSNSHRITLFTSDNNPVNLNFMPNLSTQTGNPIFICMTYRK